MAPKSRSQVLLPCERHKDHRPVRAISTRTGRSSFHRDASSRVCGTDTRKLYFSTQSVSDGRVLCQYLRVDLDAAGTLIQAIATVVALAGVIVTFVLTSRGQKHDRERAERAEEAAAASAERSENAAALTIDSLTRIAAAVEEVAAKPAGILPGAPAPKVRWELRRHAGDTYMLTNTGTATAYNVRINAHPSLMAPQELPAEQELAENEALTFMAARTFGTSDSTITVTWSNKPHGEERETWRYPLPPRPGR